MYPFYSISPWYGKIALGNYKGLDGLQFMHTHQERFGEGENERWEHTLQGDYDLVRFINENIGGHPVLVEADGSSYTTFGRIAVATGVQNIFNWYVHQQLWRSSDFDAFNERVSDIRTIYTSHDAEEVRALLDKYNVEYIVIGRLEHIKYEEALNVEMLLSKGEVIFDNGTSKLIRVQR
jgi:uncharacterized membrane protein